MVANVWLHANMSLVTCAALGRLMSGHYPGRLEALNGVSWDRYVGWLARIYCSETNYAGVPGGSNDHLAAFADRMCREQVVADEDKVRSILGDILGGHQ